MKQVKLFISDIDGCLGEPYRPYRLDLFQRLAAYADRAEQEHRAGAPQVHPRLSLCSGRAFPYVEALTQALHVRVPVIFESGGGIFDLPTAQVRWNPNVSAETMEMMHEVRDWLIHTCIKGTSMMFDYGKRMQVGVIGPNVDEVQSRVPLVEEYVGSRYPELKVYHTTVSIDVLPAVVTKVQALHWLAEHERFSLAETAFIGDTNGDIEALRAVGVSFAPANAAEAVKAIVQQVSAAVTMEGVLQAYSACIEHNRKLLSEEASIALAGKK